SGPLAPDVESSLNNPLISTSLQVLLGALKMEDAVQFIKDDSRLTSLNDEALRKVLAEAEDDIESRASASSLPLIEVVLGAVRYRIAAVAATRKIAKPEDRPNQDLRLAGWLTALSECYLRKGRALLVTPALKQALEAFRTAEAAARSLPDFGQLR